MQETQTANISVALYCRVSTEEQREGQTIDSQVAELRRFCDDKKWTIADVYRDEGWSGSLLARPALDQLRDHAQQGRFKAVLVNDVDRLARDVSHLGILKRDLEGKGVQVIFRKLPGEESPTHNLLVNILGSFAEFERELIADRTRRGRRHKVEVRGQHVGAIPPYGFKYIRKSSASESGHLEVIPEEAVIVREMYGWVDKEGLSTKKVTTRLNALGVRPRKGGSLWRTSSVRRILRSETYAGVWHYNKHIHSEPRRPSKQGYRKSLRTSLRLRPKQDWIPVTLPKELVLIDRERWARVQHRITLNTAFSARNTKHFYLLRGLVRCGGCNGTYVGDPRHGEFAYRCIRRCKQYPGIREAFLNDAVWNAVRGCLEHPETVTSGIRTVAIKQERRFDDRDERNRALEQIEVEEKRLLHAYRTGVITDTQLAEELKSLKARRSLLSVTKTTAETPITDLRQSLEDYRARISARLGTLTNQEKREILEQVVSKIIYYGNEVKIVAKAPIGRSTTALANDASYCATKDGPEERIANLTSEDYVRNSSYWNAPGQSDASFIEFEFMAGVQRDQTARIAACRRNLVKAAAARWKHHEKHRSSNSDSA